MKTEQSNSGIVINGHIYKWRLVFKSATFRLAFLMFIIIVPICILTIVLNARAIRMAESQVSDDIQEALSLNMNQVDNYLQNIGRRLYTVSHENDDYARILSGQSADADDPLELIHSYTRLSEVYADILSEYTWADNVAVYFPLCDYFISAKGYNTTDERDKLLSEIEQYSSDRSTQWKISSLDPDLLLGIFEYKDSYYIACFDLEQLLSDIRLESSANIVCFARSNGEILTDNPALSEVNVVNSGQTVTVNGESYMIASAQSEHSNLVLVDLISRSQLDQMLPGFIRILFIISIIFLCCIPVLFICFGRWMVKPVNILIDAIRIVDDGQLDYRINDKTGAYEFDLVNSNFNSMLDSVQKLKIDVYEKEIEKQDIRLQYLSQQIQPHFILNAMNIIYSYEPEQYDLIQKMVLCLSKYFQFIVNANRPYVKIKHELEHISNYLKIQQIRYGERLRYQINVDDMAADAVLPPLMIQNLVENIIKYALKADEIVDVNINAECKNEQVTITIRDNGLGIKDDVIERIETFKKTNVRQEGLGVGIQNTIERLKLFFGHEADFSARRIGEDGGTEVTLKMPLRYMQEENE